MTVEELKNFMTPWLTRLEEKLDRANGRSHKNAWNIRAIWIVFGGLWSVFLIWLRYRWMG